MHNIVLSLRPMGALILACALAACGGGDGGGGASHRHRRRFRHREARPTERQTPPAATELADVRYAP